MFCRKTESYRELREYLDTVPVIETHEHYEGTVQPVTDILDFLIQIYYKSDLFSAAFGMEDGYRKVSDFDFIFTGKDFDQRYGVFRKLWEKSNKTSYAKGVLTGLKECWGIQDVSKASLLKLKEKFEDRNNEFSESILKRYGVKAFVADFSLQKYEMFLRGERKASNLCRFAVPLPYFHNIHIKQDIRPLQKYLDRYIVCLDDYMDAFEIFLKKGLDMGAVCMKDQSAYRRRIEYMNPAKGEAEKVFNKIVYNPRTVFGDDEVRVLDDWLFHQFLRLARKYDLPIQVHTGHMAGARNEIVKTNAVHITSVFEMYTDIRFDLFHGNWPFMDEYLFLGKNYPNVYLDLCWVQSIDPVYCVELMKRAVVTVPHAKVMAFGGDTASPEWTAGYLVMARDNVAFALSEMVDTGWMSMNEAREVCTDWFFNNPNRFFKLGFKEVEQ